MMDKRWRLSNEMAELFEWDKWREEIPFIPFRKGWEIKIIPPRRGAVVRFLVREPGGDDISVYLDCYDVLGCFGSPYWEIYPAADGGVERYEMEDVDGLLDGLERALEKIGENKEKYEEDRKIVQLEEQLESSRAECRLLRDLIEKVELAYIVQLEEQLEDSRAENRLLREEMEKMELAYNTLDERYRRLKDETRSD